MGHASDYVRIILTMSGLMTLFITGHTIVGY